MHSKSYNKEVMFLFDSLLYHASVTQYNTDDNINAAKLETLNIATDCNCNFYTDIGKYLLNIKTLNMQLTVNKNDIVNDNSNNYIITIDKILNIICIDNDILKEQMLNGNDNDNDYYGLDCDSKYDNIDAKCSIEKPTISNVLENIKMSSLKHLQFGNNTFNHVKNNEYWLLFYSKLFEKLLNVTFIHDLECLTFKLDFIKPLANNSNILNIYIISIFFFV